MKIEGTARLLYYNDGKEKWLSHEIYSKETLLRGYGASKEEAYADFTKKLDEYLEELHQFRKKMSIENTVTVDCLGRPIRKEGT